MEVLVTILILRSLLTCSPLVWMLEGESQAIVYGSYPDVLFSFIC